jgi:hypothetical protein
MRKLPGFGHGEGHRYGKQPHETEWPLENSSMVIRGQAPAELRLPGFFGEAVENFTANDSKTGVPVTREGTDGTSTYFSLYRVDRRVSRPCLWLPFEPEPCDCEELIIVVEFWIEEADVAIDCDAKTTAHQHQENRFGCRFILKCEVKRKEEFETLMPSIL